MPKVKIGIRIGIGSMFIIAAILKLISIDEFEIYIYSFNIFGFIATTFISRLIIAGEFIIGLLLIIKTNYKFAWRVTMTILILFTLFLAYTAIFRNDNNCHCFGELVELSPIESIIKNIVTIFLLIFIKPTSSSKSMSKSMLSLISISTLSIIFIISPPDIIYNKIFSAKKEISSHDFYKSLDNIAKITFDNDTIFLDTTSIFDINKEKQTIAIVSSGCKYCKLGIKKLSMIKERNGEHTDDVDILIWGSPKGIINFRKETLTENYSYWHIYPNEAIKITYGKFPIFINLKEKEIKEIKDFRSL